MGYRGSKSIVSEKTIVKEQRVDGSLIYLLYYKVYSGPQGNLEFG